MPFCFVILDLEMISVCQMYRRIIVTCVSFCKLFNSFYLKVITKTGPSDILHGINPKTGYEGYHDQKVHNPKIGYLEI